MFLSAFTALTLLIGWIYSLLNDKKYTKIWTGISFVGYILMWLGFSYFFNNKDFVAVGFFVWTIGLIGLIIHFLLKVNNSDPQKLLIFTLGVLGFYPILFRILHWPYSAVGMLLGIIPAIILIVLLITKRVKTSESLTPYIVFTPICVANFIWLASFWFK